jgi:parallel beta-helix repeat protein
MTNDVNITAHPSIYSAGIRIRRSNIIFNGNGHILMGNGADGFAMWGSDYVTNVTIENSTATGFETCLLLDYSHNNTIKGNTFYGSSGSVVVVQNSNNNIIDENSITSGTYGADLVYYSANNTFTRNYIANNTAWSIAVHQGAGGDIFYHNIISGNAISVDGPASTWDNGYPSGGNYWSSSNYVSPDLFSGPYQNETGADGIGDQPYQVYGSANIDHYPFMMVSICNVSQTPPEDNVLSTDIVSVNATVIHVNPLEQVILNCTYSNSSTTWTNIINMTNLGDDVWNGIVPPLPVGTNVTYAIVAQDNAGNSISSENQGYNFEYPVVPEFPSILILPLFFMATLLAVIINRRKHFHPNGR